jgi:hypothetical protein
VWLTGFTAERGKPFTARGIAKTGDGVVQYLQALTLEQRLRDVKLVASANNAKIDETPVVQFSISAFPIGNLTLADPEAKKSARPKS